MHVLSGHGPLQTLKNPSGGGLVSVTTRGQTGSADQLRKGDVMSKQDKQELRELFWSAEQLLDLS